MSFASEYDKLRKKRLVFDGGSGSKLEQEYSKLKAERELEEEDEDIAPVRELTNDDAKKAAKKMMGKEEEEEEDDDRKWFQKGAFEDGYQFGDITKTIFGSDSDLANNVTAGILGIGEKVVDTGATIVGGVAGLFGNDNVKDKMADFAEKDLYDEHKVAEKMNSMQPNAIIRKLLGVDAEGDSVFGEKTDDLAYSGGQLVGTVGLQSVGVPWYVTTGATSFGGAMEGALREGATFEEAAASSAISAGAEILSEKLFGGSGLGETGLINLDGLTKGISNKLVKALADYGVDIAAEGFEEIFSQFAGNFASSLYKEDDLKDLLFSEEAIDGYIEGFIGGGVLGGGMNVGNVTSSIQSGKDYRSGLTANEEAVVNKVYEDRIAEAKENGETLTAKEKDKIYEEVVDDLNMGFISIEDIEGALGGDTYMEYKNTLDEESELQREFDELGDLKKSEFTAKQDDRYNELKQKLAEIKESGKSAQLKAKLGEDVFGLAKGSLLENSYNERANRGLAFDADLNQYDAKQQEIVKKAIDSGILNNSNRTHQFVDIVAKISADKGVSFDFVNNAKLKESGFALDGKVVNGFVTKDGISINIDSPKAWQSTVGHEITHVLEGTELYGELQTSLLEYAEAKGDLQGRRDALAALYDGVEGADVDAELTADLVGDYLFTDSDFINNLSTQHRNVFQKVYDEIKYLGKVVAAGSKEARQLEKVRHAFEKAYRESGEVSSDTKQPLSENGENVVALEGGAVIKYSLSTWTPETQTNVRENLIKVGYEPSRVDKWIKDTNSVASVIAADKDRLDFEAADNQVMLKDNQEYIKTLDASTLCAKRLVYQGTFDAIQHRMPDTMLSSDDLIDLLNMMKEHGIQTPCGVCYVESRRRHLGKFAQDWLNSYKGEYKPHLDEVTTSDGLEALRKTHPQTYKDFVDAMNKKGSSNPKVVQLRTEYRNEIMSLTPSQIRKIEAIGGLRVQSFSDFETPHMLDMMQAVMDMSAKGLHSQAYTKVPNFAWVFGDTGIKINLSLIAEGDGFDADGNLVFSSTEGMDIDEAMRLRDAYSKNVGTIIVGANDKHILACMADDRIDFIIPFHRSGWGMRELEMMGMDSYTDYTTSQKEYDLETGKAVANLYPPDYWDYVLSGKENAERYLNLCARTGRKPKFSQFLVDNGDGSYSLQPDGSTDGYWKTLIDFKMYDNEGNGAPQQKVQPDFNMDEAYRVLGEYEGGANTLPVANDVVEEFVAKYQAYDELAPAMSLSAESEAQKRYGSFATPARDLRYEAPVQENVAPVQDSVQDVQDTVQNVNDTVQDDAFAPVTEDMANAMQDENMASLTDADAPPETEAPFYGEGEAVTVDDPFEDRDIKDVGNRKVKAYMFENPEVKPFFQAEANVMLGELRNSTKGERFPIIDQYDGYIRGYSGVQRNTSQDIAYLLDECGYTYDEIEKGLRAIIEDHGAENNACSKRIEFLLNDRLLKGNVDFETGMELPPNQEYINLLNEKQITEYNEESFKRFMETADQFAPPSFEDIGPVKKAAPIKEAYEAIRPPRQSAEPRMTVAEPRMKRADNKNMAPDGMEERSWYETSTGSEAVDGMVTPDDIPDDVRYYQVKSNKKTLDTANARLARDGYAKSREYFEGRMTERKLTVEDIALGERLIQEAAKAGDAQAVRDLIIDVSILGTELGQRVQALSIIRRLTPEGQLKALIRTVERGKAKGDKAFEGVKVTDEMADRILSVYNKTSAETVQKLQNEIAKMDGATLTQTDSFFVTGDTYKHRAKLKELGFKWDKERKAWYLPDASRTFDQAELDRAVEDVKQQIADQMSVSIGDKINAWRYLSMLGNPKTHIRNIVSNVAMFATRHVKNAIARTIEDIAPIKNRTKTWRQATDAVKAFAKNTTAEQESVIKGDNKYSDEGSIKAKRKIFESKALHPVNVAMNFNTDSMEAEDWIFSRNAYRTSLQEYLTANGIKTEQDIKNNPELIAKAKEYALEEAKTATFRQDSYLANKISEIEKKNPLYGVAVGSIMPFKKTPINIAKTGAAYSPLGFARNIYDAVKVSKGEMDASEAIDHLAQTLTGTSLALIGYALAEIGFLNGAGDDDKEGKYDYQLGKQSYSFNFGGDTYSLSWLSPVAMPLFVGANAYETLVEKNEWDANVVIDTLGQTLDPMSEMSFLSSLDDVLSSYDSGIAKIWGAGESMVQNYATQFVPTAFSQIASAFDDTKRSTRPSGDSGFEFGEETLKKIAYKIPGLRNTLEPTTDIWGNDAKQSENGLVRGFDSFLSPANKRAGIGTAVDDELKALYSEVGKSEILPAIPYDYINYGDTKYDMAAKDYTEYKQTYGQTAYDLMESLFETNTYRNATSDEKADMVADVYDYARDAAKKEYLGKQGVNYTNAEEEGVKVFKENPIKGAIAADLPVDEYTFSQKYPEKYNFFKANGITYDDYDAADEDGKRAYTWAADNPGKYTLSKAVTDDLFEYRKYTSELYDIKADKDEDGKTINGSAKEKKKEYIFGLDLDYGQKIILYRSLYDSKEDKNTYNADIVQYLDSRDDISLEEMKTILEELGMKMDANGWVTWD